MTSAWLLFGSFLVLCLLPALLSGVDPLLHKNELQRLREFIGKRRRSH